MRLRRGRTGGSQAGWAMVFAVFVTFIAGTMASLMFLTGMSSNRNAEVNKGRLEALYLAEGALEAAEKEVITAIANWETVPAAGTIVIGGTQVDYTIATTGFSSDLADPSGIVTRRTGYELEATAEIDGVQLTAHRIVNAAATPLFQFAVFYTEDLEIMPGPSMELGGRVHTNGSMYLGSGNTLTMNTNYVRAVGDIYRVRKDDPSQSKGSVDIRRWVADPYDSNEPVDYFRMNSISQMDSEGVTTVSGYDSNFTSGYDGDADGDYFGPDDWAPWTLGALEYWSEPDAYVGGAGNTVQTSAHGMTEAVAPSIGSIAMFDEATGGDYEWDGVSGTYVPVAPGTGTHGRGFFHGQADLVIQAKQDGSTWYAFDGDGNDVSSSLTDAVSIETMYDARQGGDVQVVEIDMEELADSGVFPANGLLYASHFELGTGTDAAGVRLVDGAELLSDLTVVTDGSLYLQGDYNTDDKKSSAVIADAVNLLSNDWDDSKTVGTLPDASRTTYNTALITGNHATVGADYNGGLENLPRFHEAWSGEDCVIRGSFVSAWASEYASGTWEYGGDRYKAPGRRWSYDTDFNSMNSLPPFTPMAVSAEPVVTW